MKLSALKGALRMRDAWFLLSLTAALCLPLALFDLLRGADLNLLTPATCCGMVLAWRLAISKTNKLSAGLLLLAFGPLALTTYIGGMWKPIAGIFAGAFRFLISLIGTLRFHAPVEFSTLLSARDELIQKGMGLGSRLSVWALGFAQGSQAEDPLARTWIWVLVLWLTAVWAGWHMNRQKRVLDGIAPTTLLLAFLVDYSGGKIEILLLHLGLVLLLMGLANFTERKTQWEISKTDYSESAALETLGAAAALTVAIMAAASLASSISVKELLEKLREEPQPVAESQTNALGLKPVKDNANIAGIEGGLPRAHLVTAGPELSQQLVMTISTGELSPMPEFTRVAVPRHYWRALTYQVYDGRGWRNPTAFGSDIAAGKALIQEIPPTHRVLTQLVTFSAPNDRLYWAGTLRSADTPFEAVWLRKAESAPLLHSNMLAALAETKSYRAESLVLNVDAAALRQSPAVYPQWVKSQFLSLPESIPARVHALARDLTVSASTPYDRALAIETYLRTFPYTLEVDQPPPGRDAADYFLFDLRRGYCDYYATAMAVLARAAGLPARLVAGYANGAYDYERARYVVTENYAHSWVEIYFTGIGWVEFEPTASQPPLLYEEKRAATPTPVESAPAQKPAAGQFPSILRRILAAAWLPFFLTFAGGLTWFGFDLIRLHRLAPSQVIQILYRRLRRLAQPVAGRSPKSQTAYSYASHLIERLSDLKIPPRLQARLAPSYREVESLADLFCRSLFAPRPPTRADANAALKIWSRLMWRLLLANAAWAIYK